MLRVSRLPTYGQLLKLGKERKGAIFLDIGCSFANDIRKAVINGYPVENAIASDLEAGDALDANFLKQVPPFYTAPETPRPDLHSLTTLTHLLTHISAIHASSSFHLFNEGQQLQLARSLAGVLSPEPGSAIFGVQGGLVEKG